jgi:DNA-binding transcriptional MerR regulator
MKSLITWDKGTDMTQYADEGRFYSVTELAQVLDVTPRTIRFYEQKGLLAPQRAGKTRVYTHRDKARLQLILRGKRLGFSLSEIKEYLDLYDTDHGQSSQIRLLLNKVADRIDLLEAQQRDLEQTLKELYQVRAEAESALTERIKTESDAA